MYRYKKYLLPITLVIFFIFGLCIATCTEGSDFHVTIDDNAVEFSEKMGHPYFTDTNRTMVPVRIISENMGYNVDWDNKTQTVYISDGKKNIELQIGKSTAVIDGKTVPIDIQDGKPMDTKATLVPVKGSSRTYVPLRFVSEAMGAEVKYEKKGSTHHIRIVIAKAKTESTDKKLEVHFIDVGQGDSILIKQGRHNMLIDAGDNKYEKTVVAYLKDKGIVKLDYVVGTHPHADHIGGLDAVIDNFEIGKVIIPKVTHTSKTYEDVLLAVKNKNLKITVPNVGDAYGLGDSYFTIVAPNSDKYSSLNNYSVVIYMKFEETSFLFTGDAETLSEKEILAKGQNIKADILKVGHHGSDTSSSVEFLDKVNPDYAIIQVGEDNKYGHPHAEIIEKLNSKGIKIYRNDLNGDIVAISDGQNIDFIIEKN
jgi:beta-lactamase superfamily II metal-dependent hydrolase